MRFDRSLLKLVAVVLFVIAAILFFAQVRVDVDLGLASLGLAALAAAH